MIENRFLFPWPHSFSVEDNSGIWQISGWFSILLLMSGIWCNQLQALCLYYVSTVLLNEQWWEVLGKVDSRETGIKEINSFINKDIKEIRQVRETLQRPLEHVISFSLAHLALSSLAPVTYAAALSTVVLYYDWDECMLCFLRACCDFHPSRVLLFLLLGVLLSPFFSWQTHLTLNSNHSLGKSLCQESVFLVATAWSQLLMR